MSNKNSIINSTNLLNQYQHIVDATNIVSKTDTHGIITYANSKFIEISGYSLEELIGKSHNIVRDASMPKEAFKDLWQTIKAKKIWNGVVTNKKKDGSQYTVEASIFPILDSEGEIVEYIAIRHNITDMIILHQKVETMLRYDQEQQHIAKEKSEAGIVNDLQSHEYEVLFAPSDILSGDFYSIFKRKDGSLLIYLIDGQGHGISPSLTVFAISAIFRHLAYDVCDLNELLHKAYPVVKNSLGEIEQVSYTMIIIDADRKKLSYASGGMYPFMIKKADAFMKIKANNTPFMNFLDVPKIEQIDITGWEALVLYSDGIIEHENEALDKYTPEQIIHNPSWIKELQEELSKHELDDDTTLLYVKNVDA